MAVDSAATRSSAQNDLIDLQIEFERKKKRMASAQDEELQDIKKSYQAQKLGTIEENIAAVNHIKQKQNEELGKAADMRQKALERGQLQVSKTEEIYKSKSEEVQEKRSDQLVAARDKYRSQLGEIQQKNNSRVENVRDKADQEYKWTQDRYKQKMSTLEKENELRLGSLQKDNNEKIQNEVTHGRDTYQKVREENTKDTIRAQEQGRQALQNEKLAQQQREAKFNADSKQRLEIERKNWNQQDETLNKSYTEKLTNEKQGYEDQLHQQNVRFGSVYQKNESANRTSLQIQSQNYAKGLAEEKRKFLLDAEKYQSKEADPFYKVQDRGSSIKEHSNYYVLEAYVPEHEKDAVKVVIEKDKAVIAGQRAFNDQFEDDNKKVSSNNYQTFREEFSFDKPVIMEGVARERSGDHIIFTIPKLNSFSDRKINRKA